jgi:hypothetical protein
MDRLTALQRYEMAAELMRLACLEDDLHADCMRWIQLILRGVK